MPTEKNTSLPLPNLDLPFFSYGIFKRDFICHFRIEEFIEKYLPNYQILGELRVRDGLPILKSGKNNIVYGDLIYFKSSSSKEAYQSINDIEPNRQYKWKEMDVQDFNQEIIKANVLDGVKPDRGSSIYHSDIWERVDVLFSDGMQYIEDKIYRRKNEDDHRWQVTSFYYENQASYLLLWSIIERYASLRYYLKSRDTMAKIKKFSKEKIFVDAISKIDKKQFREVFNASDPKKKIVFDASDPLRTINYFYQIRSNITHRGKGVPKDDYFLVKNALEHLHSIFAKILDENRLRF